ncbi:MAG: peptidylprolyl isomerase [Patescibacteria group bacterium]
MNIKTILFVVLAVVVLGAGVGYYFGYDIGFEKAADIVENEEVMAEKNVLTLHTNKGDIGIELFLDETPITAGNFLKLAQDGFYDGTKFHRVIAGFMIQGGDPNSRGDDPSTYSRGGPGYTIPDEFAPGPLNNRGTLSMANAGPNTGGSQFFINLVNNNFLDGKHAVFGQVVSGMEVVDAIAAVRKSAGDVPLEPVVIESVSVSQ